MYLNEIIESRNEEVEFQMDRGVLRIPKGRNIYNELMKKYNKLAGMSGSAFIGCYKEYKSWKDILDKAPGDFRMCLSFVMDEMKKDSISMGRFDIDNEFIYQSADARGHLDPFKNVYKEISRKILNASQNSEYKTLERLFKNPETIKELTLGVYGSAFLLHLTLIELLKYNIDGCIFDFPDDVSIDTAERLFNNIKDGSFEKEKEAEIFIKILELNPYKAEVFSLMLEKFGDRSGRLGKVADYYGIDFNEIKNASAMYFIEENQGRTEEDAKRAKEELLAYCDYINLPVREDLECISYIDKRLEKFDLIYRTVDDIVCSTREEADFARGELEGIQKFMEEIEEPTSESLLDYENDLLEKKREFEETFQSELKEKYLSIIEGYLEEFEDKFCTIGLFKKVDRKTAGKERLLKIIKKMNLSSIEKIEEAYVKKDELLPKVGITEEEASDTIAYLETRKDLLALEFVKKEPQQTEEEALAAKEKLIAYCNEIKLPLNEECKCMQYINKRLEKIDLMYRTVDGVVCATREEADKAKAELPEIHEFMRTILAPTSESLLDYEEDLLKKKEEFDERYSSALKEKYMAVFDKYLKDFDRIFCSAGLFKKVDRKEAGKKKALKFVKNSKISNVEEVEKTYENIKMLLPKLGITEEEAYEAMQYLEKKEEKIKRPKGLKGKLFGK